jgi:hypothetical protein
LRQPTNAVFRARNWSNTPFVVNPTIAIEERKKMHPRKRPTKSSLARESGWWIKPQGLGLEPNEAAAIEQRSPSVEPIDDSISSSCYEDLSDLLHNLDVDKDFNLFKNSMSGASSVSSSVVSAVGVGQEVTTATEESLIRKTSGTTDASGMSSSALVEEDQSDPATLLVEQQDKAWAQRLEREEIYSHRYLPTVAEQDELEDLEATLGIYMHMGRSRGGFLLRAFCATPGLTNGAANVSPEIAMWNRLVHPQEEKKKIKSPRSIILKRGFCVWRQGDVPSLEDKAESDELDNNAVDEMECELILLTHGLVVSIAMAAKDKDKDCQLVVRQFSQALMWSHVQYVRPLESTSPNSNSWQIVFYQADYRSANHFDSPTLVWTFHCKSVKLRRNWLKAMERVIVQHHMHSCIKSDLGWQYRYIHTPGFTLAVTDDDMDNDTNGPLLLPRHVLFKLDRYCGYSPLHYAVRCHNERAVYALLMAGADPNLPDRDDGKSPIEYATRDPAPREIQDLLARNGGRTLTSREFNNTALFGQVSGIEQKRQEKRDRKARELELKATMARMEIENNLIWLHMRGDQIDDMGNKATEMNDGAQNFAAMAKQLKARSAKGAEMPRIRKWLPFQR